MTFWLRHITRERSAWLLLGLSAVFLEVCALLFQHVLGLRPCLMCIYERLVVLGSVRMGCACQTRRLVFLVLSGWNRSQGSARRR